MDIRTRKSIQGYIARRPQLKRLPDDRSLFIAQLGQKHYRNENDGGFTLLGTSYIKLVMLGENAEEAFNDFTEGDDVVALGDFKTRTYEHRGNKIEEQQFLTTKLLFDTSRRRYTVERTPRTIAPAQHEVPTAAAAVEFRTLPVTRPAALSL